MPISQVTVISPTENTSSKSVKLYSPKNVGKKIKYEK